MSSTVIDDLRDALGPGAVLTGPDMPDRSATDWSGLPAIPPIAVVRPASTAEVSAVLRICSRHGQAVTPQGGLTGLVGGARPSPGSIALSLERLTGVESIDPSTATMVVRAGTPLEVVQKAADDAGLFFALDIGSRGSCTIGGNLATNAGGNRVLRYGMARDLVLGLEAVLPSGVVLSGMNRMVKNNTGLDIKQMFIGSEGTLGVITRAVLKLHPRPASHVNAVVRCPDYPAVTALLQMAQSWLGGTLSSFEAMWPSFYNLVIARMPELRPPFPAGAELTVIIEAAGSDADSDAERFERFLVAAFEAGLISDAVVAKSEQESRAFWAVRHAGSEYPRILGEINSFDISFSSELLGRVVEELESALRARWPTVNALSYGHVGDGNIHLVVHVPDVDSQPKEELSALVYRIVGKHGGSISGEHGIGTRKLPYLGYSRDAEEVAFMRLIKQAVDPNDILNPGKMLPAL